MCKHQKFILMDYKTYYCTQAKSNQIGTGLPIQGKAQLDPNNLEFLENQFNSISKNKQSKVKKALIQKTKSGVRRKPKNNQNIKIKKKLNKRKNKSIKKISKAKHKKTKRKELDIFI